MSCSSSNTVPPTVVSPPISSVVVVGTSVALDCVVDGTPPPNVTWYKDTVRLVSSARRMVTSKSVYIRVANVSDTGVYMCVAENVAGRTAYQASITVTVPAPSLLGGLKILWVDVYGCVGGMGGWNVGWVGGMCG